VPLRLRLHVQLPAPSAKSTFDDPTAATTAFLSLLPRLCQYSAASCHCAIGCSSSCRPLVRRALLLVLLLQPRLPRRCSHGCASKVQLRRRPHLLLHATAPSAARPCRPLVRRPLLLSQALLKPEPLLRQGKPSRPCAMCDFCYNSAAVITAVLLLLPRLLQV
jgi:hypothetical protein